MIVYHGSFCSVDKPDIFHSRKNVDFGKAFYVTPIFEQAHKWSKRFADKGLDGYIYSFEFDERIAKQFKIKKFNSYSKEWLDFIVACRRELDTTDYDIVIGGVANDKVFNTIELYFQDLISKTEAIKRLKYEKPNLQIAFRNQTAIDKCLVFKGCEKYDG